MLTPDEARRRELATFLQSRRARLSPTASGLTSGKRRRTPGLRREEVAQLAGVGVTWYTWLEQGRDISVSEQVLESIACALQLDGYETRYLFALAKRPPAAQASHDIPDQVSPAMQELLTHQGAYPAFIQNRCWDMLAWTPATTFLLGDLPGLPAEERNYIWLMFARTQMRQILVGWEEHAQRMLAEFRISYSRYLEDERFNTLVERLRATSAEFRAWWPRHEVVGRRNVYKEFQHPIAGRLYFEQTTLLMSEAPDLRLVVKIPLPQTDTAARLQELAASAVRT
jgi:transcriptional regulator with XRE-family HTH domain